MPNDDTPLFANFSDAPDTSGGEDEPDDPDDSKAPSEHRYYKGYRSDSPRIYELPPTPGPRRSPFVPPADVHKVNGRQLNPTMRTRDRDMLNR